MLRRVFEHKKDEVTGGLRKLPNIIRVIISSRMRWTQHLAHTGYMRNAYKILVGKPEGKRPPGRLRHR
jgi:hypothetical protein